MNQFFSENIMAAISADKTAIVTSTGTTYIGDYSREKYDPNGGPIEEQPIWRIKKIEVATAEGEKSYETKYPNGMANLFGYKWSEKGTLSYSFAINK